MPAPPFQLKARMEPNTVMAGEPVTVAFRFEGTSKERTVIFADSDFPWCTFEIVQKSTVVKSWVPNRRGQYLKSIYLSETNPNMRMDLSAGQEISVVMPTEVLNLPVGDYKLRLSANLPYKNNANAKDYPLYAKGDPVAREVLEVPFFRKAVGFGKDEKAG